MNLKVRSNKTELLDGDNIPRQALEKNLRELEFINKWLGGHHICIRGLQALIRNKKDLRICEIGCGGGDNLAALINYTMCSRIKLSSVGIDLKAQCLAFAKKNPLLNNTLFICDDYRNCAFQDKPDVIFSSLFCHHFSTEELITQIRWMKENSLTGFFINDLQRNAIAYHSIKLLTRLFSRSYLVKNDAPLSVARALTKKEWRRIFEQVGIVNYKIEWRWAFRYLIIFRHDENA